VYGDIDRTGVVAESDEILIEHLAVYTTLYVAVARCLERLLNVFVDFCVHLTCCFALYLTVC